jgi:short-subunit dehydrogenase
MARISLITGASSGIGLELARLFAQDRYNLILVARREERLNEIKRELEQNYGVHVEVWVKDLSKPEIPDEIFREIKKRDLAVDVLVNNAGLGKYGKFADKDWRDHSEVIRVNIVALTQLTKLLLPEMVERKNGKILNVASTAAFQPGPLMSVYYATKAYVLSFSEALANELKGTGVGVTVLCPGTTATEFHTSASQEDARLVRWRKLPSAASVAKYGYQAMKRGQVLAIPGLMNKFMTQLVRWAPRKLVIKAVRFLQEEG